MMEEIKFFVIIEYGTGKEFGNFKYYHEAKTASIELKRHGKDVFISGEY